MPSTNLKNKLRSFVTSRWTMPVKYVFVCMVIASLLISGMAYVASVGASTNPMYASFDGGGTIGGVTFADDDILRFNGSTWSLFFDGSDVGLNSGVDTTAFALVDNNTALFVFDTTVVLGGVTYEPSDIVQFDATQFGSVTSGTFSMYFNGIDVDLNDTVAEKIDAVSILPDNRILISTTGNPS